MCIQCVANGHCWVLLLLDAVHSGCSGYRLLLPGFPTPQVSACWFSGLGAMDSLLPRIWILRYELLVLPLP